MQPATLMRDPAVCAVFALHLTGPELAAVLAGAPVFRQTWPPGHCRGAVVGLHADGAVVGEARLGSVASSPAGSPAPVAWTFGPVTLYAAPLGTLTPTRVDAWA